MKTLYLIGGTMGIGKTTISQQLKIDTTNKTVQVIADEIIALLR